MSIFCKVRKTEAFYIGCARNVEKRLWQHNAGQVKATRYIRPFKIVYSEVHKGATEARKREYYIKSQKSRKFIGQLIAEGD